MKRKIDVSNNVQSVADEELEKEHEESTKVKNIKVIEMGANGTGIWQFKHLSFQESLFAHSLLINDVPGFWGPNIGIRKKNRTGGGGLAASMAAAAPVESSMKELMTRGASASIAPLPKGLQDVKDESKLRTESL